MSDVCILAIDQGTSGTKALVFDGEKNALAKGYSPLASLYPGPGWVEQDPEAICRSAAEAAKECAAEFAAKFPGRTIDAIGISNQRETFLIWDKSGCPLCNAVSWQCKRSIGVCAELKPREGEIRDKTGLLADPYFSGTKAIWLYRNNDAVRQAIDRGEAYFGTIDTWLLYKFTGNYFTDHTNSSRTLFFNLDSASWDVGLLAMYGLENLKLPEIKDSGAFFGETDLNGALHKKVPIHSMIGDSQAAAFGEGCVAPGIAKATLGTGSSIIMNTGGAKFICHDMVRTLCYSTGGEISYGVEGIIVSCGSPIQWIRDELKLCSSSAETEAIAGTVPDSGGVFLIPAFSGMGAPFWKMDSRGQIAGLTFGTTRAQIVRAALESIAFQVRAVIDSMESESGVKLEELRVDGGIASNKLVTDMIATLLDRPVKALCAGDISAMGAALMAGLGMGAYRSAGEISSIPADERESLPVNSLGYLEAMYGEWFSYVRKM